MKTLVFVFLQDKNALEYSDGINPIVLFEMVLDC
jgi:hypothetical protein